MEWYFKIRSIRDYKIEIFLATYFLIIGNQNHFRKLKRSTQFK